MHVDGARGMREGCGRDAREMHEGCRREQEGSKRDARSAKVFEVRCLEIAAVRQES